MNVKDKEAVELEDVMAQDDKSSKEKDVLEKTAEVVNNVSDVQEEELVESNILQIHKKKSNLNH